MFLSSELCSEPAPKDLLGRALYYYRTSGRMSSSLHQILGSFWVILMSFKRRALMVIVYISCQSKNIVYHGRWTDCSHGPLLWQPRQTWRRSGDPSANPTRDIGRRYSYPIPVTIILQLLHPLLSIPAFLLQHHAACQEQIGSTVPPRLPYDVIINWRCPGTHPITTGHVWNKQNHALVASPTLSTL